MNKKTRQIVLPLFTAFIWGCAFVAQKSGAALVGALTFTGTRYLLAGLALLAFLALRAKRAGRSLRAELAEALPGALALGTLLMVASNLQQYGVGFTTAGKAGFVTALYIVLVPLLGLFLGKRARLVVWCGVAAAVAERQETGWRGRHNACEQGLRSVTCPKRSNLRPSPESRSS